MIRTLAWKESREHWTIWTALAGLSLVGVVGVWQLIEPAGFFPPEVHVAPIKNPLLGFFVCTAVTTYGLVCGSMMLAGEREAGTLTFLDSHARHRSELWKTKCIVGMMLTLAQVVWVAALCIAALWRSPADWNTPLPLLAALAPLAIEGFAWGMFASAFGPTVLFAAGISAGLVVVVWLLTFILGGLLGPFVIVLRIASVGVPFALSWRTFCRVDRERNKAVRAGRFGLRLLWLTWRQARPVALLGSLAALVLGLLVLNTDVPLWPIGSLALGLVCGAGVFGPEQGSGANRFLGDQRLPPSRVWGMKVATWLAVLCGTALLLIVSSAFRLSLDERIATAVSSNPQLPFIPWLLSASWLSDPEEALLWPVYGFALAQFCGLLFRKGIVALVVAVGVSLLSLSVWLPSIVCGGLGAWQLYTPPLLLLIATRLGAWSWMANRLYEPKPLGSLLGLATLAALWIGGNVWYRGVQLPDVGEPFDVKAFVASLPSPEKNEAATHTRAALAQLPEQERAADEKLGPPPATAPMPPARPMAGPLPPPAGVPEAEAGPAGAAPAGGPEAETVLDYREKLHAVVEHGWPKEKTELGPWLDHVFAGEWVKELQAINSLPAGVLYDPQSLTFSTLYDLRWGEAANVLAARAIQLQARKDHAGALEPLTTMLSLSRTLRHDAPAVGYMFGMKCEHDALAGLGRWGLQIDKENPALLRRALDILRHHEALIPPAAEALHVEYLVFRNTFDQAPRWPSATPPACKVRADAMLLARQVWWEGERWRRSINLLAGCWTDPALAARWLPWDEIYLAERAWSGTSPYHPSASPNPAMLATISSPQWTQHLEMNAANALQEVRRVQVRLAQQLYKLEKGHPAEKAADLVPGYLPALLLDPNTGEPVWPESPTPGTD